MAQGIRQVTNTANLDAVLTSAARKILTRRAGEVLSSAQASAGDAMKDTLRYTVDGVSYRDMSARIGSSDTEAIYEEKGTRPHIIRARNGRVMKFPGTKGFSGKIIYTAIVRHPGTAGKHTLRNALRKVIGKTG